MRRGTVFVVVLAVLAVTLLWWVFLVAPRNAETADVEDNIEAEKTREATLLQEIANLQDTKDQEVSYLFAIGQMENAIPEFPDADVFLEELNFLAERTGVVLSQVTMATPVEPADDTGGPLAINATLSVEGQYFEVLGFLYGLEAMERLVRVETISLRPIEVADEDGEEGPEADQGTENLAEGPRPRPDVTTLEANLTTILFTRTPVAVEVGPEDTTTTTTTTTVPGDTTTTTVPGDTTTTTVAGATTTTTVPGATTTTGPGE